MLLRYMPVNTKFRSRRPMTRSKQSGSVARIAKGALRQVKEIKRQYETKYLNTQITTGLQSLGSVTSLVNIAQGDTAESRDGNMVNIRSIKMHGFVSLIDTYNEALLYRMIVFQDSQQVSDTNPAVTDILLTATMASNYNYPTVRKRFKILYDKVFSLTPSIGYNGTALVNNQPKRDHSKFFFPTRKNLMFNGSTATDLQKNGVFILLIASENVVATPNLNFQLSFNDN